MLALFVLMIVPVSGWYFIGDLGSHALIRALPAGTGDVVLELQREIRFKLAITLCLSIVVFAAVVAYVRHHLLDPLERLAERARRSQGGRWTPPGEVELADEVGDLARALDHALSRLQERADRAERFAADLSHELRTPLAAIRGAGEILAEDELDCDDRLRFARHVLDEAQRLERLVGGLLDLARADHLQPATAPLVLPDAVRRIVGRLEPILAGRELAVEIRDPDRLEPVRASEGPVARVMTVLLENALRHSPPGGKLLVQVEAVERGVAVAICDQGPGVSPELRERVFDRCFSTEAHQGSGQGTGLGLAICRALVERMGGEIVVDDSPLGGARFAFVLPTWQGRNA